MIFGWSAVLAAVFAVAMLALSRLEPGAINAAIGGGLFAAFCGAFWWVDER